METAVSRSTAVNTLLGIGIAVVLLASVLAIVAVQSYVGCASRLLSGASPSDLFPPATFRRFAAESWQYRDLYLARVLAQECAADAPGGSRRYDRELLALGAVRTMISSSQRETLGAVLLPAPGGRGLTRSAMAEWGRPPADLNESEMTWLFVVGQQPRCSRHRASAERDRDFCANLHQSLLAEMGSK